MPSNIRQFTVSFLVFIAVFSSACVAQGNDDEIADIEPLQNSNWLIAPPEFRWPDDRKIAVSLTYDDAITNHTEYVGPLLSAHDIQATFYVTVASQPLISGPDPWIDLAKQGHELGSHTLFHPCRKVPSYTWLADEYDLKSYSAERFTDELAVTNAYLELLDGKKERTYGNTCNNTTIGSGDTEASMQPILAPLYLAARGALNDRTVVPSQGYNIMELGHYDGDQRTFDELRDEVLSEGDGDDAVWLIYMIHGVGEGSHSLFIDKSEHEQFIHWLDQNREQIWVAPVVEVASFAKSQSQPALPQ